MRGLKDHKSQKYLTLHAGSEAQDKACSQKHGLWDPLVYVLFWVPDYVLFWVPNHPMAALRWLPSPLRPQNQNVGSSCLCCPFGPEVAKMAKTATRALI